MPVSNQQYPEIYNKGRVFQQTIPHAKLLPLKNFHLPIRSSTHHGGFLSNLKRYIEDSRISKPLGSLELTLVSTFRCWLKEAPQAECRKVWSLSLWVVCDIFPETLDQKGEIRFHRSTCVRLREQLSKRLASDHKALKAFELTNHLRPVFK